jgi:hypothetical protein
LAVASESAAKHIASHAKVPARPTLFLDHSIVSHEPCWPDLQRRIHERHPQLPPGTVASLGPAQDCIVDNIDEFETELASPATNSEERLVA